jgi:hypothetical protein
MKLFIHEIVPPTVKKGIYIDTDAFWITDPKLLWNVFSSLKPSTAIVASSHPDQVTPEWHNASRICSCVMLLDLEKLRAMRLMDSSIYRNDTSGRFPPAMSPSAFRAMYGRPQDDGYSRYENVRLGDQGYWWAIVDYQKDIFEPLSYDFEITSCLLDTYLTGLGDDTVTESEALSRQIHTENTPQEVGYFYFGAVRSQISFLLGNSYFTQVASFVSRILSSFVICLQRFPNGMTSRVFFFQLSQKGKVTHHILTRKSFLPNPQ